MPPTNRPKLGVVLSGGGSRGAYEAGIIHYVRTDLARRMGRHAPMDIVTGTSVGAINAAFLAATMSEPDQQAPLLAAAWRSLRIEQLIGMSPRDLWKAGRLFFGSELLQPEPGAFRYGGLVNTSGLEQFVLRSIPWAGIDRSLRSRALLALSVSATHIGTGHTVVFLSSAEPVPRSWSRDPFVRHRAVRIGPRHVLASAAIPLLFPAVKIGDHFYTDGGLRQNTPMSPAIRLGADRLLVVSLRHVAEVSSSLQDEHVAAYPKPLFMAGKALNALLLDHTEYDLQRMERINAIIDAGRLAFGPTFDAVVNSQLMASRGAPLRRIHSVHIRPSVDIGALASQFVTSGKLRVEGRIARRLIQRLAEGESPRENDLLSYLLFDGDYAAQLIDLGRADAARQEDQLAALFDVDGSGHGLPPHSIA